ncbi:hypothetical protein ACFTWH_22810 [Streptomyces sp. NPDC057011]|uniref:hypothetical protein n=1 Tax=unclassified Streptomyces TaxID=2593676 RepID=UPI003642CDD6
MHAYTHARIHATRSAELAAEAAAWRLAREADTTPTLRNRLGQALIGAGMRLLEPAHAHTRVQRPHAA